MKDVRSFLKLLYAASEQFPKCFHCNDHTRIKTIVLLWNSNDVSHVNYSTIKRHKEQGFVFTDSEELLEYPALYVYVDYNKVTNIFTSREDESTYRIQLSVADQYIGDKENTDDIRTKHEIYFDTEQILLRLLNLIGSSEVGTLPNTYVFDQKGRFANKFSKSNREIQVVPIELGSQKLIGASVWLDVPIYFCIDMNCPE